MITTQTGLFGPTKCYEVWSLTWGQEGKKNGHFSSCQHAKMTVMTDDFQTSSGTTSQEYLFNTIPF